MAENWVDVLGYYQVSDNGRIRSVDRWIQTPSGCPYFVRGRLLKPSPDSDGYLHLRLCKDGVRREHKVHHIVLLSFGFPRPCDLVCRHLDGNPANNCLSNLMWGTIAENHEDQLRHGTRARAARRRAFLCEREVKMIKRRLLRGDVQCVIADNFGVSKALITLIKNGSVWRNV